VVVVMRGVSQGDIVGVEKHGIWNGGFLVGRLKLFLSGEPWRWLEVAS
jgi:hypothetical protein